MTLLLDAPIDLREERWQLPITLDPEADDYSQIIAYREQEFKKQGWADYLAKHLAESDVDYHQLGKVLRNGCPPDLALDIFFAGRV